jgi:hypothetical protein
MNDESPSIQIGPWLKERLAAMARAERRSLEDEAICLIEDALRVFKWGMENGF